MSVYNTTVIVEDRATLGIDPSATITAYSIGRYPLWYRPFITNICCCHQCDKSIFFKDSVCKLTLIEPTFLELILFKKGKGRLVFQPAFIIPGDDLLSPLRTTIGLTSLASVFGMGTGVSPPV